MLGCWKKSTDRVPIDFWQNSDPSKKEHVFSSKNNRVRPFFSKSLKNSIENLSSTNHKGLKRSPSPHECTSSIIAFKPI